MKTEKEIKKRIKDLNFFIYFAKSWNFLDKVKEFENEKNILEWVLCSEQISYQEKIKDLKNELKL